MTTEYELKSQLFSALDTIKELRAENAELKKACADACHVLRNDQTSAWMKNTLAILSTGEAMYLDEYDGPADE